MMVPIVAPPERRYFTRQPTDCDQALQPNDGILPGNPHDSILPGNREDEVKMNWDWCEGYFIDRDTEPIEDPIFVLPIKKKARRSRSGPRFIPFIDFLRENPNVANCGIRPGFNRYADPILDMVKSCVPELTREGLQVANSTILEVQTHGDIQFSTNYMAMSDTQMVRAFARQAKRAAGRYYVGITEHPVRRLGMHACMPCMPFIDMLIVRVAATSSDTAYWEKLAIRHFREQLGHHALLNVGDGGEHASGGIPHYGYILRCR